MNEEIDSNKHSFLSTIAFWWALRQSIKHRITFCSRNRQWKIYETALVRTSKQDAGGRENAFNDQTKMKNFSRSPATNIFFISSLDFTSLPFCVNGESLPLSDSRQQTDLNFFIRRHFCSALDRHSNILTNEHSSAPRAINSFALWENFGP